MVGCRTYEVDRAQLETDELLVGNFLYQGTVTDNHLGSDLSKPKISKVALLVEAQAVPSVSSFRHTHISSEK